MNITYINCPECDGSGMQLETRLYPPGHTEIWVECKFCAGEGNFDEEDFLVMKLDGTI